MTTLSNLCLACCRLSLQKWKLACRNDRGEFLSSGSGSPIVAIYGLVCSAFDVSKLLRLVAGV